MPERPLRLAVLGATGAVGRALLKALEDLDLPLGPLRLVASERSAGAEVEFRGEALRVEALAEGAFQACDLAFFAAGAGTSLAWAEKARAAGCAVVDLSPAFRADPDVPLVLPEVNLEALSGFSRRGIVAAPGPGATQLSLVLAPLHRAAGVERASVTSLESASGGGRTGVEELEAEMRAMLAFQEPPQPTALPHRIAFNLVPQVGPFGPGGASEEERALAAETRRLLGSSLRIAATSVRVPLFYGLAQAVNLRLRRKLSPAEARELLGKAPGVKVLDDPAQGVYPMPMLAVNDDAALVGRIREDASQENGLDLFIAADNLHRGAATTAVAIARALADRHIAGR
jgi:aspartate-semialdehyde dehydrogenase